MADAAPNERTRLVRREGVAPADDYDEEGVDGAQMHKIILACSWSWFMWNVMYTMIIPMLPVYGQDFGLSTFQKGLILGSLQFGFLCGVAIFSGGMRPDMAIKIGGAAYIIGPALIALDPGLTMLVIGRIIEGFGAAPLIITHDAIMARRLAPHQKGRAYGIKGAIGTSGLFFGPIIGSVLYAQYGLRGPMICISALGVLGAGLYWNFLPDECFEDRNKILDSGTTFKERSAHFGHNNLLHLMMTIQLLTFIIIGIFFLIVPDFLVNFWGVTMNTMVMIWLSWDIIKVLMGVIGGGLTDSSSTWHVCFAGLIIQSFMIFIVSEAAGSSLNEGSGDKAPDWKFGWFVVSVAITLGLGTTIDGFIGGPFVKLLTEIERLLGQECYEELFTISVTVVAFGEMAGNFYAGWAYDYFGFNLCTYGFAWCHLIGMLCCGYGIQGSVRPLFETEKKGLDDPDAV